jgi:uncharacterized membrane protein YfcA
MFDLSPVQWSLACFAALIIGISKTGMPGVGILGVPLLAMAVGGRASLGVMLPLLIGADFFAIAWYRRHARWDLLFGLAKWVFVGVGLGALVLWWAGASPKASQWSSVIIGSLVIVMLVVHFGRKLWGDRLLPTYGPVRRITGVSAGFATTVSNAAGPVTTLYLAAAQLDKDQFMGTSAWFYFTFNLLKIPIFVLLGMMHPNAPVITSSGLMVDLWLAPAVVAGAFLGRVMLKLIPESIFESTVLGLAGVASVKLLWDGVVQLLGS